MKSLSRLASLTLLLVVLVGFLGCKADTSPVPGMWDEVPAYPKVTLAQPSLQAALGFQEPSVTRMEGNLMRITLPVRARSNEPLHIEYRVIWFDEQRNPLRPEMTWRPARLEPRQPEYLTVTSSSPKAVDYSFQLRWSRP